AISVQRSGRHRNVTTLRCDDAGVKQGDAKMGTLTFQPHVVAFREDHNGVIRVGESRVLLELIIHAYQQGETPEGIVDCYDTLNLADVYAIIAYYLDHREEVDRYLREQ